MRYVPYVYLLRIPLLFALIVAVLPVVGLWIGPGPTNHHAAPRANTSFHPNFRQRVLDEVIREVHCRDKAGPRGSTSPGISVFH